MDFSIPAPFLLLTAAAERGGERECDERPIDTDEHLTPFEELVLHWLMQHGRAPRFEPSQESFEEPPCTPAVRAGAQQPVGNSQRRRAHIVHGL